MPSKAKQQQPEPPKKMIKILSRFGNVLQEVEADDLRTALQSAVRDRADLSGAYLSGAYLSGAYLSGAYLSGADLSSAYLSGADLRGAYLSGADLSGADLSSAYLSSAYLSGADLRGADLSSAYLRGAYLSGAYLMGADLSGADLSGAYLKRADLSGADLSGADLSGAYLKRADLSGARINWQSHSLISELLRREAGDDVDRRKIAGLILVSEDWCWNKFIGVDDPLRDWALDTLAACVREDDDAPALLRERKSSIDKAKAEQEAV